MEEQNTIMPFTQKDRAVEFTTPLGENVLLIKSLVGTEELGRLYKFELELISENTQINFDDIIGQNVTIRMNVKNGKIRYFNGYVSCFIQSDPEGPFARYHATVTPWLWFLTQASDCRIFQKKTVPQIIEEVLKGHGFDNYEPRLTGDYRSWEYCVQYRETDFNFVSRLMEQEGIYYYFSHEKDSHTLILADSLSTHESCPGYDEIGYRPPTESGSHNESITYWMLKKELLTSSFAHTDFDFMNPKNPLKAVSEIPRDHAEAKFEFYDPPGEYLTHTEGDEVAKIRIEEIQARHSIYQGKSDARGILLGGKFSLTDYYREDRNQEYMVTSIQHIVTTDFFGGDSSGSVDPYQCAITAIVSDTQFRCARLTAKPTVSGPQTAIVVGSGEIHTDEYGRVKIQFHWDRDGKNDENSSCWVRVSQNWAGKKWGGMFLPHVGHEVIVEFLEGDPDRPIITGRVYNADNMPPEALPGNKTKSIIRDHGKNEIILEGAEGDQNIRIFSPVQNTTLQLGAAIEGNVYLSTEGDEIIIIKGNRVENITQNVNTTVEGNVTTNVTQNCETNVTGNVEESITGNVDSKVTGKKTQKVSGKEEYWTETDSSTGTYGQKQSLFVGMSSFTSVGLAHGSFSGGRITVNAAIDKSITGGLKHSKDMVKSILVSPFVETTAKIQYKVISPDITLDASAGITLECEGSKIEIDAGKVKIKAPKIILDSPKTIVTGTLEDPSGCKIK